MRPHVVLHTAVSADGRTDWFSPDVGLYYTLAAQWHEDATLAGSETLLQAHPADDDDASANVPRTPPPQLDDRRPLLVVPDSRGRVRNWDTLRSAGFWRGFIALCTKRTPADHFAYLERKHIKHLMVGEDRVDLCAALEMLHERYGVRTVRVDSGGTLNGILLRAGLVDEVSLLVHPALIGGTSLRSSFRADDLTTSDGMIPLKLKALEWLGEGVAWLRYDVVHPQA
jgi:2,5-diamino-6-(ribosylamino)-4(3H)-pyrimidinone 5'-phosphate reductase